MPRRASTDRLFSLLIRHVSSFTTLHQCAARSPANGASRRFRETGHGATLRTAGRTHHPSESSQPAAAACCRAKAAPGANSRRHRAATFRLLLTGASDDNANIQRESGVTPTRKRAARRRSRQSARPQVAASREAVRRQQCQAERPTTGRFGATCRQDGVRLSM